MQMIKYGVIGQQALEQDLHHWSQLYVSGRLHKPVAALLANAAAEAAVSHNLHSALVTALLLSPSTISLKVGEAIVSKPAVGLCQQLVGTWSRLGCPGHSH